MENASKALIMAASILLGVMIISVAVALFNSFSGTGSEIIDKISQTQITEFNNQFLKYEAQEGDISAYDVLTMTNLAKQNNSKYELEPGDFGTSNYIKIQVMNNKNFETSSNDQLIEFIKGYNEETDKYYIANYSYNSIGRINYIQILKR